MKIVRAALRRVMNRDLPLVAQGKRVAFTDAGIKIMENLINEGLANGDVAIEKGVIDLPRKKVEGVESEEQMRKRHEAEVEARATVTIPLDKDGRIPKDAIIEVPVAHIEVEAERVEE